MSPDKPSIDSRLSMASPCSIECQYLYLFVTSLPIQHWTALWVVVHVEISPNYSYIGYCKKESDWLADSQTISKCYLDEAFSVQRPSSGYSKKYENVLQLVFKGYQLDLGFDSVTKLDQWFRGLQVTSGKYHNRQISMEVWTMECQHMHVHAAHACCMHCAMYMHAACMHMHVHEAMSIMADTTVV